MKRKSLLNEYWMCFLAGVSCGAVTLGHVVEMRLSDHRPFPNGPVLRLCAHTVRHDLTNSVRP